MPPGCPAPSAAAAPAGRPAPRERPAPPERPTPSEAAASSQMPGESTAPTSSGVEASPGIHPGLEPLLLSPPAEWEDGTIPVPDAVLRRIATDCEITRVVLGADSQVLDVGRTQRTFAGHLRRAVVARDRHCVVPGCTAPPSMSQIHHASTRWADGGATSIENAALVCGFHNQWLEDHRVPIRRVVDENGLTRWQLGVPGTYRPGGGGRFVEDDAWQPQTRHDPPDAPTALSRGRVRGARQREPGRHDVERGAQDQDEPP